ncbi:hypothetical protein HYV79_05000 [Candidatus Woesearchaeota archaeon]|nr:hypothetical protein [Candidatus Woesearchaeota archaeon]
MEQANLEEKKPEKKYRTGAISATIWKNQQLKDGKAFSFHSISIERSFKNKEGEWQSTNSFKATDLPKVALLVDEAYKYVLLQNPTTNPIQE